jgi:hypothetical protein
MVVIAVSRFQGKTNTGTQPLEEWLCGDATFEGVCSGTGGDDAAGGVGERWI